MRVSFATMMMGMGLLMVTSAPARAQTAKDKAKATALLKQVAALLESKDAAAALEKFQQAYAVVPSPKIQFNLGLAYEALARPALALRAFTDYLDGARTDDPARRHDAEGRVAALRAKSAFLDVTCDQTGAAVSVDGNDVGRTPLPAPLPVDPGSHQIVVTAPGSDRTWTRTVSGKAGASMRIEVVLAAPPPPTTPTPVGPSLASARPASSEDTNALVANPSPSAATRPVYEKAWFWSAIGAVVVVGIVTVVALASAKTETQFTCQPGLTCWKGM